MKKAEPSPAAYNIVPRIRDLTYEEWRDFYAKIFDKVAIDIWKNCDEKGLIKTRTHADELITGDELADIRQRLELFFYEEYLKFRDGSDKRMFPSFAGGFYIRNYYICAEMFLGYLLKSNLRIDSIPHDDPIWMGHYQQSVDFFEEWEKRVEVEYECDLCKYFEEDVGVSVDDLFGEVFGFWWMGYSLREIANLMNIGYKYIGEGARSIGHVSIKRKLDATFVEIEEKLGLNREKITAIRDECIRRNPLAEKPPDPPGKRCRPFDGS